MEETSRVKRGTSSTIGKQLANPSYASFPKPIVAQSEDNPFSPENIYIRQQEELGELEEEKAAKKKASEKATQFTAMTGPRNIPGGDTAALQVLASLYDSPVIRMFIAANQRRKI